MIGRQTEGLSIKSKTIKCLKKIQNKYLIWGRQCFVTQDPEMNRLLDLTLSQLATTL